MQRDGEMKRTAMWPCAPADAGMWPQRCVRGVVLVLVCAVALAACGDDDAAPATPDGGTVADGGVVDSVAATDGSVAETSLEDAAIPDGGSILTRTDATGPYAEQCKLAPQICDDGNPCTVDGCDAVVGCTAVVKTCADDDSCTLDACDVATGNCSHVADPCDDGNACTSGSCSAAEGCTYVATDCSDGDACTSDGCTPAAGCQHAKLTCDDGKTCTADSCDPVKGCVNVGPAGETCCETPSDCEDGSACTAHTCVAGLCKTTAVFGCCAKDSDCDDGNACTTETCTVSSGTCGYTVKADKACCKTDIDCDDGNTCTADRCTANTCSHEPTCCKTAADCAAVVQGAAGCAEAVCAAGGCAAIAKTAAGGTAAESCCKPAIQGSGFEVGDSWTYEIVPSQTATWSIADGVGKAGAGLRFATAAAPITGGGLLSQLRFAAVTLPLGLSAKLQFSYKGTLGVGDQVRLRAITSAGAWLIWQGGNAGNFVTVNLDLSGLAARASTRVVKLVFEITQAKGSANGWTLDEVQVTSTCQTKSCSVDSQCNDGIGATSDFCAAGTCAWGPPKEYCEPSSSCDDANPCTNDVCVGFACQHYAIAGCCQKQTDCDDKNPCSQDFCNGANQCQHVTSPGSVCCNTAADCNDNKLCTLDACPVAGLPCVHTQTDANCCDSVADCDDKNDCTVDACGKNQCSHKNICCKTAADCDDGDPLCTDEACVGGKCQWTKLKKPECCDPAMLGADFEGGVLPAGFAVNGTGGAVKWQAVQGKKAKSGTGALYYGNPATGNFDNGQANQGTVTLGNPLAIAAGEKTVLTFWLYMHSEGGSFDDLGLEIKDSAGKLWVPWLKSQAGVPIQQWQQVTVDLSAFGGQTVTLQLRFDTKDSIANDGEGVYVDDVTLTRGCAPLTCSQPLDCDDKWPQSSEKCDANACQWSLP